MPSIHAKQLETQVWDHLDKNDVRQAIAACERLNREFPNFASGWHTASQLALKLRNPSMALDAIREALRMEPEQVSWALQEALCLAKLGRNSEVSARTAHLLSCEMSTPYEFSTLGSLLTGLGERKKSRCML